MQGNKKPTKPSAAEKKFLKNIEQLEKEYNKSILKIQQEYETSISQANKFYFKTGEEAKYWELVLEANACRQEEIAKINENFINERNEIISARTQSN